MPALSDMLSERERDVLELLCDGYENQEIGEELHISKGTVARHLVHIGIKLHARNRTHAAVLALRGGLIETAA